MTSNFTSARSISIAPNINSSSSEHANPTILITGASQGCGRATALLFAKKGYNVILAARLADRLHEVADEIQSLGCTVLALPTDVTSQQEVEILVSKALDYFGRIDVLLNNAGVFLSGPLEEISYHDLERVMNTNFWGYVYTIKALLPHFLERKTGSIVNMIGIAGRIPSNYMSVYCASKYAVKGLTDSLRMDLKAEGIQVCGIYPNWVKSDLMERALFRGKNEQEIRENCAQMNNNLNSRLAIKPEDVAQLIWDAVKKKSAEVDIVFYPFPFFGFLPKFS
jgi:NADP-dependent 3-hydroxy acid dehydrogenase YdfG